MKLTPGQALRTAKSQKDREAEDIAALARRKSIDAFLRIVHMSQSEELLKKEPRTYLAANIAIIERGYGKAPQKLEHTGEDGGPMSYRMVDAPPQETFAEWQARKDREAKEADAARLESAAGTAG